MSINSIVPFIRRGIYVVLEGYNCHIALSNKHKLSKKILSGKKLEFYEFDIDEWIKKPQISKFGNIEPPPPPTSSSPLQRIRDDNILF